MVVSFEIERCQISAVDSNNHFFEWDGRYLVQEWPQRHQRRAGLRLRSRSSSGQTDRMVVAVMGDVLLMYDQQRGVNRPR